MMSNYQQLTYEQRCQISALSRTESSQRKMADCIGLSQSTVSRELARNSGKRGYRHKQAQEMANTRRQSASRPTKMNALMIQLIVSKLRLEWSPEQVSGWLREEKGLLISHESIYLYVWTDKRIGGDLYKHLRRQDKKYDKRRNGKSTRGQIKNRVSIDDRPSAVDESSRIGDWEIDTVIGKGHSGALVTLVERVTKMTLSAAVKSKNAEDVTSATIELLKPYKEVVQTITADNGKEFTYHQKMSKELSANVYFAYPYSSWERGLNENTNGLLRQYFPKSTDFKKVSRSAVDHAVKRLNGRPRKGLGFKTPDQLISDYIAALAA